MKNRKPPNIYVFMSKRIRQLRLEKAVSQKLAALRSGIPQSSYSSLETGAYRLSIESLYRILQALNADISEIWPSPLKFGVSKSLRATTESMRNSVALWKLLDSCLCRKACVLLEEPGRQPRGLARIGVTRRIQKLLVARILGEVVPTQLERSNWTCLSYREGLYSIHLCMKRPRLDKRIRRRVLNSLSVWLADEMFRPLLRGVHDQRR